MSLWGFFSVCHRSCVGSICADGQLPGKNCFTSSQWHTVTRRFYFYFWGVFYIAAWLELLWKCSNVGRTSPFAKAQRRIPQGAGKDLNRESSCDSQALYDMTTLQRCHTSMLSYPHSSGTIGEKLRGKSFLTKSCHVKGGEQLIDCCRLVSEVSPVFFNSNEVGSSNQCCESGMIYSGCVSKFPAHSG